MSRGVGRPRKHINDRAKYSAYHKRNTLFERGQFVAWDGEGITENGIDWGQGPKGPSVVPKHRYALLANSKGNFIWEKDTAPNVELDGISTKRCLDFLTEQQEPMQINVCFGASYDVNMMLKDLTEEELRSLVETEEPTLAAKDYLIAWRHRKRLYVKKLSTGQSLTMYDVQGFFQTSFVRALEEYKVGTKEIVDRIRAMKLERSSFDPSRKEEILAYCLEECRLLVELMDTLRAYFREAGFRVSSWDGVGALARFVLQKYNVKNCVSDYRSHPAPLQYALRCAYAGGRIETVQVGLEEGAFYDYDINSAYPHVLSMLPNFANGEWKHISPYGSYLGLSSWMVSRLTFSFPAGLPWYPLFVRQGDGSILFPRDGRGWYWADEAQAAIAFASKYGGKVWIEEAWEYVKRRGSVCPFHFIPEIYAKRLAHKDKGEAIEVAYKLAQNSCYGKTIQQIGGTQENPPPYFSLEWGGLTTSITRSRLTYLALQARDPASVIFFATDGLLSKERLTDRLGKDLGQWNLKEFDKVLIAQAGYYYLFKNSEAFMVRSRGLEKDFASNHGGEILEAWKKNHEIIGSQVTRFVTLRTALMGKNLSSDWRTWITRQQAIFVDGRSSKRYGFSTQMDEGSLSQLLKSLKPLAAKENQVPFSMPYETFFNPGHNPDYLIHLEEEETEWE